MKELLVDYDFVSHGEGGGEAGAFEKLAAAGKRLVEERASMEKSRAVQGRSK